MGKKILDAVAWGVTFATVSTSLRVIVDYVRNRRLRKAKELGANIGIVLKLKDDEIAAILEGGDYEEAVFSALDDGRYDWDGEIAITEEDIAKYNERYHTTHSVKRFNIPL